MATNHNGNKPEPKRERNTGGAASTQSRNLSIRPRALITWGDIDAEQIGRFVQHVAAAGCGVILGRTSDGGALSVVIMDGDERIRQWPHTAQQFDELHVWVCEAWGLD